MAKKLEIERKYLLKRLPVLKYGKILHITQYYLKDGSRIRLTREGVENLGFPFGTKPKFYLTKKKKIKAGIYEEDETFISEKRFFSLAEKAESVMKKTRYIYKAGKLKWEIDVYQIHMVTAEIELPRENYQFKMPPEIRKQLIMDVTEFQQFTSRSLSDKV